MFAALALAGCSDGTVDGPTTPHDAARSDATRADSAQPPAPDAAAPDAPGPTDARVAPDSDATATTGCSGSASGTSPVWTCTTDRSARQRCVSGAVQTEPCAHGCSPQASGLDDICTPDCGGTVSAAWACTADGTGRQRCASGAVQTEHCPSGCVAATTSGGDAVCGAGCAGSASGTSSIWTCTSDRRARQRCVSNAVQTEACASGCVPQPLGTDDYCASASTGCTGSASGTSSIWTCTTDRTARQRCVSSMVQTESCPYGCAPHPLGTDDTCNPMPAPGSGTVSCAAPQWWNLPFSWDPGYYAVRYGWDNDLRMASGTPVQLRHNSRLLAEGVYAWGWMPEFSDDVTGQHFRFLHLQPSRRLTTAVGTDYPAGTIVGYSGGDTTATGYMVPIPGCTGTGCVYSTGAHLCVQTQAAYRTAFPAGMDACR